MNLLRIRIPYVDRIGLVQDISQALASRQFNIFSMEVEPNAVFLETSYSTDTEKASIFDSLKHVPDVIDVEEIFFMPYQEKAEQTKSVLAAVSDGIVAINQKGIITHYNPAAERIIRIPYAKVIGRHLSEIAPHPPLLDTLEHGTIYNNREMVLESTKSHYLASGRPICDQTGRIIGAVSVLKDISDVRELVYTVTGQITFTFDEILYSSKSMHRVVEVAKTIAKGDSTVLIRGETGTGKELFARAIHSSSPRSDKVFVPLNCSAIPDPLLESELFGYEEGSFTGAAKGGKQGLFEFANNGTIFLDEIGELSSHLQAKLLRVLQDGKVRRIGGTRETQVNVRILAATNRNLEEMLANSTFREDLYYRLNVIPIFLPPLRERHDDIPSLAGAFLQRYATRLQKQVEIISETAMEKLMGYHWPGNIRELENVIERAVNIVTSAVVLSEHIILDRTFTPSTFSDNIENLSLEKAVEDVEREILTKALAKYHSSRQLGAVLGISHTAVLKKLRKYNLQTPK